MNQARTYVYIVMAKSMHFAATTRLCDRMGEQSVAPKGGGVLSSYKLMGMCHWMDSHFHGSIDYNWATFFL